MSEERLENLVGATVVAVGSSGEAYKTRYHRRSEHEDATFGDVGRKQVWMRLEKDGSSQGL